MIALSEIRRRKKGGGGLSGEGEVGVWERCRTFSLGDTRKLFLLGGFFTLSPQRAFYPWFFFE